jgi:hydrogenase maturation factor
MSDPLPEAACGSDHCITCNDDGVPMTVLRLDTGSGLAECADAGGGRSAVETALLEPLRQGDRVLVHAGVAIASLPGGDAA